MKTRNKQQKLFWAIDRLSQKSFWESSDAVLIIFLVLIQLLTSCSYSVDGKHNIDINEHELILQKLDSCDYTVYYHVGKTKGGDITRDVWVRPDYKENPQTHRREAEGLHTIFWIILCIIFLIIGKSL